MEGGGASGTAGAGVEGVGGWARGGDGDHLGQGGFQATLTWPFALGGPGAAAAVGAAAVAAASVLGLSAVVSAVAVVALAAQVPW